MAQTLGSISGTIRINYDGRGVGQANKDVEGLKKKSQGVGKTLKDTGTAAGVAGVGIAAGFIVAVKAAANFETALSGIKAVSGATTKEMEGIRAKALQIGKDTAFGATDAAEAMSELIKAGLSTSEVLAGAADATVALAAAGGVELPEAAIIASNAMNLFGKKAEEMPKVADLIAGAANASAIDVGEFGRSLSQVGTVAHLVGFSFEDTATAIALLGNAGIKGSDAGTALKTMFINLVPHTEKAVALFNEVGLASFDVGRAMEVLEKNGIDPATRSTSGLTKQLIDLSAQQSKSKVGSKKQQKAYEELVNSTGIMKNQFFDAKGKVKDLSTVFDLLKNSLKNQTKEQQIATLSTLFGTDAIRGGALAAELGKRGFTELAASMNKVTAEGVAAERLNNVQGDLEKLKGSAETLAINLGTILIPAIRDVVGSLDGFVSKLNSLDPATRQNVVTYGLWAAGLLVGIAVITRVGSTIATFVNGVRILAGALRLGAAANLLWNSSLVTTLRLQALYAAGWVRSTAALVANRTATIASAAAQRVAGAAAAVWAAATNALSIANLRSVGATVAATAATVAARIAMIAGAIATGIATAATTAFGVVMAIVGSPIFLIVAAIALFVGALVLAYKKSTTFRTFVQAAFQAIKNVIQVAMQVSMTIIRVVIAVIVGLFRTQFAITRAIVMTVFNAIKTVIQIQMAIARAIISAAISFIQARIAQVRAIVAIVSGAFNSVVSTVRGKVSAIISAVQSIVSGVMSRIRGMGSALVSAGRDLIQGLLNGITGMAGAVIQKARDIANSVTSAIKGALHISSPSRVMASLGVEIPAGLVQGIQRGQGRLLSASLDMAAIPASAIAGGAGSFGGGGNTQTFGPGVVIERGAVQVTAPNGMNAAQVGDYTTRRLSTAIATRTSAPRIQPGG